MVFIVLAYTAATKVPIIVAQIELYIGHKRTSTKKDTDVKTADHAYLVGFL